MIVCLSGVAGDEICNQIDDNCNGVTDEEGACSNNVVNTPTPSAVVSVTPNSTLTPTITPVHQHILRRQLERQLELQRPHLHKLLNVGLQITT